MCPDVQLHGLAGVAHEHVQRLFHTCFPALACRGPRRGLLPSKATSLGWLQG